jgi:tetratricopeptide (TPR) repeat protein
MAVMLKANLKKPIGLESTEQSLTTLVRGRFLFVWILIFPFYLTPGEVLAIPFIPSDETQVLERLPVSGDSHARELRQLRKTLSEDPENLELATEVARRYLEVGRAESDPRYQGYAQAALRPWWEQKEPPPKVLVLRAVLRQAQHDFDAALEDLSRVLKVQPTNAQAWLTRAVILEVRGDYAGALRSCMPLIRLYNPLMTTGCISSATSLSGQAEKSYNRLRQALENSASSHAQEQLWTLTILAEMAVRLGREHEAEQHFKQALSLGLRDTYLLRAYTDFLLDQNRPVEVQALLQNDSRSDGLLLRLALAEQQLSAPTLKQHVENLRARFAENRLRSDTRHLRLEARFALHVLKDLTEALELARRNWAIQREPWDARILLEAALAAGDHKAALPVIKWVNDVHLEDERIHQLMEQLT